MIAIINYTLIFFALVYAYIVLYMRKGWSLIPSYDYKGAIRTSVSVIIAARNEEENIGQTIQSVLDQDFPKDLIEIIIVDDHSTDNTAKVVSSFSDQGVKLIKLDIGAALNSYKKYAINKAIGEAKGEIIVTTDADCTMGPNWLKNVVGCMEDKDYYMLSSPVIYKDEKNLFEELQTLEFLYLIGLGAAGIGNQSPTTCNGANLAYKKSLFFEVGGFNGIDNLASGDDELFLHKVAEKYPSKIGFCKSKEAVVYTDAKPDLDSFISQRKRWASKSTKYKNKKVVALGISIWLFNLAIIISIASFLWSLPQCNWILLSALIIKIWVEFVFMIPITKFAGRTGLLRYIPLLSVIHTVYIVYIGIAGNTGKYDWKGRKVN